MTNARVYRPTRDWKNQVSADFEDGYIGDVTDIIMGAPTARPLTRTPGDISMEGQVGIPYDQVSGIKVRQDDYLVIGPFRGDTFSTKYLVTSSPKWEVEHAFAGGTLSDDVGDYYWVNVEGSI